MSKEISLAERKGRINRVIDYIFTHVDQDITIRSLTGVAHYSPFHLQKVFKQMVGESPKQYALKLRLETAFHLLVIHPLKPIQDISSDCGFSSPAVFSRAFKSYFGYSPEQIRCLSHKEQMKLLHPHHGTVQSGLTPTERKPPIQVIRRQPVRGVYILIPFDDSGAIHRAFQTLSRFFRARHGETPEMSLYGILAPHQRNSYKAFLPLSDDDCSLFPVTTIAGGTFATFSIRGDLRQTNQAAHYFYQSWLPASGYKIAGITGFETFTEDPAATPYFELKRQIYIPIEPGAVL
jgi:AraC family transcriptional regulator